MKNYTIVTDSSCDMPVKLIKQLGIKVVPLSVFIDGEQHYNYPDESDLKFDDFYTKLAKGSKVSTSAVNMDQFTDEFEKEVKDGNDILYIGFSSGLSGTYNSAYQAACDLKEKYPDSKIYTVDSLCASLGQGLLIYYAVKEKEKGKSIDEVLDFCENKKLNICHWFTVDDLHHLKRGGRISSTTAIIGSMLNFKPVMHMNDDGKLINVSKVRGRPAAIEALAKKMEELAIEPKGQTVFISHGNCLADAKKLADILAKKFGCKSVINFVGPVIGAHSGQGTLALFFVGTQR